MTFKYSVLVLLVYRARGTKRWEYRMELTHGFLRWLSSVSTFSRPEVREDVMGIIRFLNIV